MTETAELPHPAAPPRGSDRGQRARAWWRTHCHPRDGDPGTRARLRRCRNPQEALLVPPAVALARRLSRRGPNYDRDFAVALDLARVLAHVTNDVDRHPMRDAGWPSFPGDRREGDAESRPALSEARFRRFLQAEPGEELVIAFVRLVRLLGGAASVSELAEAFLDWNDPWRQDRVKHRWALEYYNARMPIPMDTESPEESDA